MLRVLHFEITNNLGGIESLLLNISRLILSKENKIQFDFVTQSEKRLPYEDELLNLGCQIYRVHNFNNIVDYIKDVDDLLKKGKYDIVHIHKNSLINIIPYFLAKKNQVSKIIIHAHNTAPTNGNKLLFLHYINRIIISKSKVSKVACSNLAKEWIFGKDSTVQIIPNGINLDKFKYNAQARARIRKEFNIRNEDVLLTTVGRLTKQKNQLFMIDVMKKLPSKYKFVVFGKGELKKLIQSEINKNHLEDRFLLAGLRNNVSDYLQGADIFVMPSLHEGLPIAGVEAQAAGLPVLVSSNVTTELNIDGDVRFLDLEPGKWVDAIENINLERNSNIKSAFTKAGYDIEITEKEFMHLYGRN